MLQQVVVLLLHMVYLKKNIDDLTVEEAKKIALTAVKAAITRNIGTGDGINVA